MHSLESVRDDTLGRRRFPRKARRPPALVFLALILFALTPLARNAPAAAQVSEPPAAREAVLAERRIAAGYLRTGNGDLAALALERLAKALQGGPHASIAGEALAAIDAGDLPRAAQLVTELGDRFAEDRRSAGVRVLADCVREASRTYHALDAHRVAPPDLSAPATRAGLARAARASDDALARCDAEASASTKADPDFRRLIDGARASLARVPAAADTADGDLLHRLLIELRSFEQLLLFRFG